MSRAFLPLAILLPLLAPVAAHPTMGPLRYHVTAQGTSITVCAPKDEDHDCVSPMLREGPDGTVARLAKESCEATEYEVCFIDTCVDTPGRYRYGYQTPFDCGTHSYVAFYGELEHRLDEKVDCTPKHPLTVVPAETKRWKDDPAWCDYMPPPKPPGAPKVGGTGKLRFSPSPGGWALLGLGALVLVGLWALILRRARGGPKS